jgi:hypothetical protein
VVAALDAKIIRASARDYDGDLPVHKLSGQRRQPLGLIFCEAVRYGDVLTLNKASELKTQTKSTQPVSQPFRTLLSRKPIKGIAAC